MTRAGNPRRKAGKGPAGAAPKRIRRRRTAALPAPEDTVFLRPAEFERWLSGQGVRISHKSLYKTYLGAGARHQLPRDGSGKLVHKWRALELIRVVQGGDGGTVTDAIAARAEAEARFKMAKALTAEMQLARLRGELVPVALVRTEVGRALEQLKNEIRAVKLNLPAEVEGKTAAEIAPIVEARMDDALKHVADLTFSEAPAGDR